MDEIEITTPEPEESGAPVVAEAPEQATVETAPEPEGDADVAGQADDGGEPAPEETAAEAAPEPEESCVEPQPAPEATAEVVEGQPAGEASEAALENEPPADAGDSALKPVIEAIVYIAEEPVTAAQIAAVVERPAAAVERILSELMADYSAPSRGLMIREVAGGYKMATKPEHHDVMRRFVKSLKPPLKLSLAALETLATIAYKQPITAPEIMAIRGVQGAGVLKTLLDRKLIVAAGRKNVVGRPVLYKTSKEFLVQFGLKDLAELPTLKEFEELRRLSTTEDEAGPEAEAPATAEAAPEIAAEPAIEPEAGPQPEAPGEMDPAPAAETAPEAEPATDPEAGSAPEAMAGPQPEAPGEMDPAPAAETAPEAEPAIEPEAEPASEAMAGPQPEAPGETDPAPAAETAPEAEPATDPEAEPASEAMAGPQPEAPGEPDAEIATEPPTEPEPENA